MASAGAPAITAFTAIFSTVASAPGVAYRPPSRPGSGPIWPRELALAPLWAARAAVRRPTRHRWPAW